MEYFASFVDLTSHKREEDRLRFLLDELNHRTQNTFATVQAIAMQTLRGATDKAVLNTFEGRILALSKAHSLLGRENWHAVSLGACWAIFCNRSGSMAWGSAVFRSPASGPLQPKAALSLAWCATSWRPTPRSTAPSANATGKIDVSWDV